MDANVPKIRPRDVELARIQDNLANTLQGLLDQNSGAQPASQLELSPVMTQPRGPGTPYQISKLALKIHGDTSQKFTSRNYTVEIGDIATPTRPQQDVQLGFWGRIILWGQKLAPDPFVIVPGVTGIVFRTCGTDVGTKLTIDDQGNLATSGSLTAASVVSTAGFKQTVSMGTFWNTNTVITSLYPLQTAIFSGTTNTSIPRRWVATRAGSVTGFSLYANNTVPQNGLYYISKNNAVVAQVAHPANSSTVHAAYAKGTYAFVSGDVLTVSCTYPSGLNLATQADLEVETGA